jgi:outer membrane protein assembly factor BamB
MNRLAAAVAFACVAAGTASANWLHYRGPTMNGVVPESLPAGLKQPRQLWKASVGTGTAGVTVSGTRGFTAGNDGSRTDTVFCLDLANGRTIWKFDYPQKLDPNLFEGGPRATPTLDGDRVYVMGHEGDLFCLDAKDGKVKWKKHLVKDFGGKKPDWGYSGSPTVEGDLLLLDVGGDSSTLALNKLTGATVWKSGSDGAGYASPVVADLGGKRTVVMFKARDLVGLDLKSGKELWRTPWKTDYDINAATPLISGNSIFITSGYNHGAALFEVSGSGISQKWMNKSLRAHINTPVIHAGSIFGIDGNTGGGNLICLDLATGEEKWKERSVKGGSLVLAGDKLVILSEKGELVAAEASGGGFKALLRSQVHSGRCWTQPTLKGGALIVKNNAGEVIAFSMK